MENDVTYKINTGNILAKLHVAAVENFKKQPIKYYNSGIVNMDSSATMDDIKDVDFDTVSNDGIYQLAVLFNEAKVDLEHSKDDFKANPGKVQQFSRDNERAYERSMLNFKKQAYQHIKNYFQVFAGFMTADKIKIKDLEQISILNDCLDPSDVSKYQDHQIPIQGAIRSNIEYIKKQLELEKNSSSKTLVLKNLAFVVNYQLENINM